MKIGGKVICVDDSPIYGQLSLLKKGQSYIILDKRRCSCGKKSLHVGLLLPPPYSLLQHKCGALSRDGILWVRPSRFKPYKKKSAKNKVSASLSKEFIDYEALPIKEIVID